MSNHPEAVVGAARSGRRSGIVTVTTKFIIALSGFALVIFVILHLAGNLTLYQSEGRRFNVYANQLEGYGLLLTIAEIGLLFVFLVHIVTTLATKKRNLDSRPVRYRVWRSKDGHTPSNFSSRSMVISGLLILAFVAIHVWQFRFGPGVGQNYVTTINGAPARDLYRLVVETFKNPGWAVFYLIAMVLLGIHLRHGIWSAFQSMGWTRPQNSVKLRIAGAIVGIILAAGFLFIPVWIYFGIRT